MIEEWNGYHSVCLVASNRMIPNMTSFNLTWPDLTCDSKFGVRSTFEMFCFPCKTGYHSIFFNERNTMAWYRWLKVWSISLPPIISQCGKIRWLIFRKYLLQYQTLPWMTSSVVTLYYLDANFAMRQLRDYVMSSKVTERLFADSFSLKKGTAARNFLLRSAHYDTSHIFYVDL